MLNIFEDKNINLLGKWWWKLETQEGLWQQIIKARYFKNKTVSSIKTRVSDSPCWKSIMKVKELYMAGRRIMIGKGDLARVWKDVMYENKPLCDHYRELFSICHNQECTVENFG